MWPHNVRELEHLLGVALVTSDDDLLRLEDVAEALHPRNATPARPPSVVARPTAPVDTLLPEDENLRVALEAALVASNGNVSEVARAMGKTRMQIHRWMRRFALDPARYRVV
jgi:transcriptional regulator of acetoin/glycerol metabolism